MKDCVECKSRPARYWGNSYCEDCYREVLMNSKLTATVVKVKKGLPTKVKIDGRFYALVHE